MMHRTISCYELVPGSANASSMVLAQELLSCHRLPFFLSSPPVKNIMCGFQLRGQGILTEDQAFLDQPLSKAVHISHPRCVLCELHNHVPAHLPPLLSLILIRTYPQ